MGVYIGDHYSGELGVKTIADIALRVRHMLKLRYAT